MLAGCDADRLRRSAVEGSVTLDGAPIEEGTILFIPQAGTPGPKTGGRISAGNYRIGPSQGPAVGQHRVEIRSRIELPYRPDDPEDYFQNRHRPVPPDPVPARYHDRSNLQVTIEPVEVNRCDFSLQSHL